MSRMYKGEIMQPTTEWIDGQLNIPVLLRAVPQVRPILDRYGLKGCGGTNHDQPTISPGPTF